MMSLFHQSARFGAARDEVRDDRVPALQSGENTPSIATPTRHSRPSTEFVTSIGRHSDVRHSIIP